MKHLRRWSFCCIGLMANLLPQPVLAQFENPFQLENGKRNFTAWQSKSPKEVAVAIGNKLVKRVKFEPRLVVEGVKQRFELPEVVDFGRTFGVDKRAIGVATTKLFVGQDTIAEFTVEHPNDVIIRLNSSEVYRAAASGTGSFKAELKAGHNRLFIKSASGEKNWKLTLFPNGARNLGIGIYDFPGVDRSVYRLSNWLVAGPFEADNSGINTNCGPDSSRFIRGDVWEGLNGPVGWTIPRIEPLWTAAGEGSYAHELATFGPYPATLAWTMQRLGQFWGNAAFESYCETYCLEITNAQKWVPYQVEELSRPYSSHYTMLENTLAGQVAPSIAVLANPKIRHKSWWEKSLTYLEKEACKQPDGALCREKEKEGYFLVAEDLFFSVAFLSEMGRISGDTRLKKKYLDMATNLGLALSKATFDKSEKLYHQAVETNRTTNYPYVSRFNGLALFATSLLLEQLPKNHPDYKPVMKLYQAHATKLASLQNPKTGQWPRLLNDTSSATETSGNGLMTASIAKGINNGWLSKAKFSKTVELGWQGICAYISPEADVFGICLPMTLNEDPIYFKKQPQVRNSSEGLFPVLWAAMEVEKMHTKK